MTTHETVAALVAEARNRFEAAGLGDPAVDARILVAGLFKLSTTELWMRNDDASTPEQRAAVMAAIERRLRHEPVHRILGHREFYGLDLSLSAETLEPRPDTETLVELVLPQLKQIVAHHGAARILDMGTGTGAICLALLQECPEASGVGSDISSDALETAAHNAAANGLSGRFAAVRSDWFAAVAGPFHLIVSNPPYIMSSIIPTLEPEVKNFDPLPALDGGTDGLDAYRAIAAGAKPFLFADGIVAVEIGYDQKATVTAIFQNEGFVLIDAARDYGDQDRALMFRCNTA